jgi:hypothetical protein
MGKQQKAKNPGGRRRVNNRTETCADALMRSARALSGSVRVIARKNTSGHGVVTVEVATGGGVVVASKDRRLPMASQESALDWLDRL